MVKNSQMTSKLQLEFFVISIILFRTFAHDQIMTITSWLDWNFVRASCATWSSCLVASNNVSNSSHLTSNCSFSSNKTRPYWADWIFSLEVWSSSLWSRSISSLKASTKAASEDILRASPVNVIQFYFSSKIFVQIFFILVIVFGRFLSFWQLNGRTDLSMEFLLHRKRHLGIFKNDKKINLARNSIQRIHFGVKRGGGHLRLGVSEKYSLN